MATKRKPPIEITVADAATLTGWTKSWITQLARDGRIESRDLGPILLIDQDSLEAYQRDKKPAGRPKSDSLSTAKP